MPPILTGQIVVILSVADAGLSARWYCELLTAEESSRYQSEDGSLQVTLRQPGAGLELCLLSRPTLGNDRFDEYRIGLDHLEFVVPTRDELDRWVDHLDQLHIVHSGVKQPSYSTTAMVTFRDPDNIQLEFFWPGH